jgi:hypothetical protein
VSHTPLMSTTSCMVLPDHGWQRVIDAIVHGKLHLVGGREGFIIFIIIAHATATIGRRPATISGSLLALDAEPHAEELLLLAHLSNGGRDRGDLIGK